MSKQIDEWEKKLSVIEAEIAINAAIQSVARVELHGYGISDHYIIDRSQETDIDVSIRLQDEDRTLIVSVVRRDEAIRAE